MATAPKKATSVTLVTTNLSDPNLVMGKFTRTQLENILKQSASESFGVYMQGGSESGADNELVMAAMEGDRASASAQQASGSKLPCPPYCNQ